MDINDLKFGDWMVQSKLIVTTHFIIFWKKMYLNTLWHDIVTSSSLTCLEDIKLQSLKKNICIEQLIPGLVSLEWEPTGYKW